MSLEVSDLSFGYKRGEDLLSGISFSVPKGEVLCLLGPNGTGKTTLLRCLLGMNRITKGTVIIDGRRLDSMSPREIAGKAAFVPQSLNAVFPYRVLDIVIMGRTPHISCLSTPSAKDEKIGIEALEKLGIPHLAGRFFNEVSGGERQMILIARALAQQSGILIMDEPAASLDYGNQIRILRVIGDLAKSGYSVVMSSHMPNHAFICDKVAMIKHGKVMAIGGTDEIIKDSFLSELYSTDVRVVSASITGRTREVKACVPVF